MITEKDMLQILNEGKLGLAPLAFRLIRRQPEDWKGANYSPPPDAIVEASWHRRRWRFSMQLKAAATPQAFYNALAEAQTVASKTRLNPMIVLPYLSPENLARLEESGVSGLDLSGNGVVIIPGKVFVIRSGQPNLFPRSEPIRNVYRGDSSLVGRVFLVKPIYRAVGEIATTIRERGGSVSLATVSKVLKTLEADMIVGRSSKEIKLLQADKLLDQLAVTYRAPKIVERWVGKVMLADSELPTSLANAALSVGSSLLITGSASAARYSVLAREPVVAAYCSSTPKEILLALGVTSEETDRFPNVDLICTRERPPFFESIGQDGVNYASPVQTYLELMSSDKRQRETAEQVREYILRRVRTYCEPQ